MSISAPIAAAHSPHPAPAPPQLTAASSRFNVFERGQFCRQPVSYSRRDFYKIALVTGTGRLDYATRTVLLDRPALMFSNPLVPYSWEPISAEQGGYFCLFSEDFLSTDRSAGLQESPLFKRNSDPVYFVNDEQFSTFSQLFGKMLAEMESGYLYKQDLLRTYVQLLLHEALKMQPHTTYQQPHNAAARLVSLFLELLERQFPIDAPTPGLQLRTPGDFARQLSVHVNHLNRAVRELTGQTTSAHLARRVLAEAKALLLHTGWGTAEIAYGLGFEYPNHFNSFFKKHTGRTPLAWREQAAPAAGAPGAVLVAIT
ncbi:helix-turn-helix domain-containing protein [Hymenobacter sp. DH14]|uniref:Helix-turn-helix domain-containing protein n=1 Tax=Hymenobacter cyanobacteriorum TaxID=2926463 RepID=A0A9X2AJR8_9BACT|nr:helix-turn-helix domain-containing protein [Hymenobacter cyanobacteriorum]MCI1189144.1 helix-turn-helix domain-containing protein [Hymenobacter cyanobacteriorum]